MATSDRPGRASCAGLHEGAAARLHVEHERVDALGDLLAHDRRGDERDALDRGRDVAQRVERRSAGAIVAVWPIMRSPTSSAPRRNSSSESAVRKPGSTRACRACRRCGPARGPTSSARRAAGGHQRREHERGLVADAAGAVLVDLGPGNPARSTRSPDRTIASVSQAVSSSVIPRRTIAISSAAESGYAIGPGTSWSRSASPAGKRSAI
jgi:hypothetical protein